MNPHSPAPSTLMNQNPQQQQQTPFTGTATNPSSTDTSSAAANSLLPSSVLSNLDMDQRDLEKMMEIFQKYKLKVAFSRL